MPTERQGPEALIAQLPAELRIKLSIGAMHIELENRQDRIAELSAMIAARDARIASLETELAARPPAPIS